MEYVQVSDTEFQIMMEFQNPRVNQPKKLVCLAVYNDGKWIAWHPEVAETTSGIYLRDAVEEFILEYVI